MEPKRLTLAVIGDSVARNYVRDVGGRIARAWPAESRARSYPELLARLLHEAWGRQIELVEMSAINQSVNGSLRRVAEEGLSADVVVIAHGGLEAVMFPPRWLKLLPCFPERATARPVQRRSASAVDVLRRPLWRAVIRWTRRSPDSAVKRLRQIGFWSRLTAVEYQERLDDLVETALAASPTAQVVLLQSCRSTDFRRLLADPLLAAKNNEAAIEVAKRHGPNVRVCARPSQLDDRDLFLFDRNHLAAGGHAVVAAALLRCLERPPNVREKVPPVSGRL